MRHDKVDARGVSRDLAFPAKAKLGAVIRNFGVTQISVS